MTDQFFMVASSLPRMGPSFKVPQTPISRVQLEKRLTLLPEAHYQLLVTIESLVWASWFKPKHTVSETRALYRQVLKNDSKFIHEILHWFLDLRSIFAAIRMRNDHKERPANPEDYWISRWSQKLIQQWDDASFGLNAVYPWLPKVVAYSKQNETELIEEFLLTHIWQHLSRIAAEHYFDFEALIIYLLRWNIVDYWARFNQSEVIAHIEALCEHQLKGIK